MVYGITRYPVRYAGLDFFSRMTVIRLFDGSVMLHSPCDIDDEMKRSIERIGNVAHIVAPGSYHYFHVKAAQRAFPEAQTYLCPGIEQVLVRGTRYIWEVAFFDRPSRTLVLVDLVENIGDRTEGVGWGIKLWWKAVFHMWNAAKPVPEYQLGWKDKKAAGNSLERILRWDFERVVLAHGDLIETDAKRIVRDAWESPLRAARDA